jgi:transcriptional/translational regulatory protein YebC/TACO1
VNRTAPEIRKLFEKHGKKLGKPGEVAYGFAQTGLILIEASKVDEERIMELALEAGADDVTAADGAWEVICLPADLHKVRDAIVAAGIEPDSAEITMLPQTTVTCDAEAAAKVMRLIDALEDHDDAQKVYHNAEIPDEVMEKL